MARTIELDGCDGTTWTISGDPGGGSSGAAPAVPDPPPPETRTMPMVVSASDRARIDDVHTRSLELARARRHMRCG
ncbi:hypothetical protein [Nocardia neocaledoniensis]|uniref:hypothetical protein n=1 Tax=Nocardia neocaledoniensis TaxID=236511 RepID=UPI002453B6FD|nr:hypothetical protein [Nocardia neocaledoniensis]